MKNNQFRKMISPKLVLMVFLFFPLYWVDLSAQVIPDGLYYIQSTINTNYCIDNSSSRVADGNNIHIYLKNYTDAQKWKVENRNGYIVIRSMNNQNYVIDNNASVIKNGNNIHLWQYNGTSAQMWKPEKVGENTFVLRSAINNSYVIDLNNSAAVNGNNIHLWQYNGTNAQKWMFIRINSNGRGSTNYNAPSAYPTYNSTPNNSTPSSNYDSHKATCMGCHGTGICRHCNGTGYVNNHKSKCSLCHGTGRCASCHGKGFIRGNF